MNTSEVLAVLSQDSHRRKVQREVADSEHELRVIQQQLNEAQTALEQAPEVNAEELRVALVQQDLVFHQLVLDLNQAILECLKVGDNIWVRNRTNNNYYLATVMALDYYPTAGSGGHIVWKSCATGLHDCRTFVPYSAPLDFYGWVFLPTRIKDLTMEQTQQLFRDACTVTRQLKPLCFIA